ncbi:hypothetical protein FSP39_013917 [Pinctada imbricata]|uniref:Otopetrin-2 n=1 Tax=Pinctada imbricata TaxID=66713 RepID=A0AA88YIG9_PINIB|nr:hypothetical protein FSP39_013917 [Pinctada imbricata]
MTHSNSDELFYPEHPSSASLSILKKRDRCRYGDMPCDTTLMDNLFSNISGLYAMGVVVFGCVIPIADIFSEEPQAFLFEGFYVYIYVFSIAFLVYAYVYLLQNRNLRQKRRRKHGGGSSAIESHVTLKRKYSFDGSRTYHTGSFYLRLGAVGFGIGSMIQNGLHFGEFFDADLFSSCNTVLHGIKPLLALCFTFIQLYFIFLNSKMCIHRYRTLARFGIMHMIATNLCVWLENIVGETMREIEIITKKDQPLNQTNIVADIKNSTDTYKEPCRTSTLMKGVVEMSSPYLYPCSIEYSLISAGVLYVMWRNIGKRGITQDQVERDIEAKSKAQRINVDCSSSSKGLFLGIFVLVATVISMITFFVLIDSEAYIDTAVKLEHLTEVAIFVVTSISVILAFHRMQYLKFDFEKEVDLEESLLFLSLGGVYLFGFFSIVAASLSKESNGLLIVLSSVLGMFQASLQTVFLLNGLRRSAWKRDDEKEKPGREFVTFLLMCNIALWGIDTFEVQRSLANPVQLDFYGEVAWTILNHISVPLNIFYRFHSTVCLSNIWKNAWKRKVPLI